MSISQKLWMFGVGVLATGAAAHATVIADSAAEFSGTHGQDNWYYGYYNRTDDLGNINNADDNTYQHTDFIQFANAGTPGFVWTGSSWDWRGAGNTVVNPPWTQVHSEGGHPNSPHPGSGSQPEASQEHWTVRRWIAEQSGPLNVKIDSSTTTNGNTNVSVYVNGVRKYVKNVVGTSLQTTWAGLPEVNAGDVIDFTLDPNGGDGADSTKFFVKVDTTFAPQASGTLLADSLAEFSGVQGQDNWYYGYYNQTDDASAGYEASDFTLFPDDDGPGTSDTDYWAGSSWEWHDGNAPWTSIDDDGGHPNGSNNGDVHWAIRRWVSETAGTVRIDWQGRNGAAGGNGVTIRLLINGVEIDLLTVGPEENAQASQQTLVALQAGDTVDLALDPTGVFDEAGAFDTDGHDSVNFGMTITAVPEPLTLVSLAMAGVAVVRRRRE